ncbi:MAG: type II secretion system major pseudopilin GspG [Akkermansiaceae bacterium]
MKISHSHDPSKQISPNYHSTRISRRRASGFTLLEMVIVLGIIAVIMGGVMVTMKKIGAVGDLNRVTGDFSGIDSALMSYKTMAGHYPAQSQGLKALVSRPTSEPRPRKWTQVMTKLPQDPWGKEYVYRYPGSKDKTRPEVITFGPDGEEGTDDDMSSQDE